MTGGRILGFEAGILLMDIGKARLLAPFMARAMTVSEAARLTRVRASTLDYWIKRFVSLGLVEAVLDTRPQQYRAVSSEFLMDVSLTMPLEEIIEQLNKPGHDRMVSSITRAYRRLSEDWYFRLYTTEAQLLRRELVPARQPTGQGQDDRTELPLNSYGVIGLSREQARELGERLNRCVLDYFEQEQPQAEQENHFFHICLVRDAPIE